MNGFKQGTTWAHGILDSDSPPLFHTATNLGFRSPSFRPYSGHPSIGLGDKVCVEFIGDTETWWVMRKAKWWQRGMLKPRWEEI